MYDLQVGGKPKPCLSQAADFYNPAKRSPLQMGSQPPGKLPVLGDVSLPSSDLDMVLSLREGRGHGTVTCETLTASNTEASREGAQPCELDDPHR